MNDERRDPPAVNPHTGAPAPREELATPSPADETREGAPPVKPEPATPASPDPAAKPAEPAGPAGEVAPSGSAAPPPSQQELAVRSALETVMDPEIGLSVIDLGLIRQISFSPGMTHIKMMLTTPFCPYAPQMMEDVKMAAMSVVPQLCEVEILPDAWSPDLMPDPGLLGFSF